MEGTIYISSHSFTSNEAYIKEANKQIQSIFSVEAARLGITKEDLKDRLSVSKYKIGMHSSKDNSSVHQLYSAMGILLVEAFWNTEGVTISTPRANPDYTQTILAIQYIPQKPKEDGN